MVSDDTAECYRIEVVSDLPKTVSADRLRTLNRLVVRFCWWGGN